MHELLIAVASFVTKHRLQRMWASFLHGMWKIPGAGIKPISPALAGNFNLIFNHWTTREVLAFLLQSPIEAVIQRQTHIEQKLLSHFSRV